MKDYLEKEEFRTFLRGNNHVLGEYIEYRLASSPEQCQEDEMFREKVHPMIIALTKQLSFKLTD